MAMVAVGKRSIKVNQDRLNPQVQTGVALIQKRQFQNSDVLNGIIEGSI